MLPLRCKAQNYEWGREASFSEVRHPIRAWSRGTMHSSCANTLFVSCATGGAAGKGQRLCH